MGHGGAPGLEIRGVEEIGERRGRKGKRLVGCFQWEFKSERDMCAEVD